MESGVIFVVLTGICGMRDGLTFLDFAQRYLFQYEMKINRAGDLSSRTFELELYSDPGAFLATAINRADSYKKGYRNSLTWDILTKYQPISYIHIFP